MKKVLFALMLKKGLHLNIIHDLDRPWKELMLGLEGWIPLYMTGQINPYYFKDNYNLLYSQIECVGGTTALSGSSMSNNIKQSKYYVTNKKEEVNYYRENAKLLLKRANILMDIYTSSRKEIFELTGLPLELYSICSSISYALNVKGLIVTVIRVNLYAVH